MLRKYIIEREIPGVGEMNQQELSGAAAKSNAALSELAPKVQWQESFVAADRTFCVYLAESEDDVRRHAEISGFPANRIVEISRVIDPTTSSG